MRSGQLRHRIQIQALSEVPDAVGQPVQSWTTVGTFWGFYRNLTGREATIARQIKAEATGQITLRNLPIAITEHHRAIFDGRVLGIVNSNDRGSGDGKKRSYELIVQEVR